MQLTAALAALAWYLAAYHRRFLLGLVLISATLIISAFIQKTTHDLYDWMGIVKLVSVLVFGLGVILGFSLLSDKVQEKWLRGFTSYVNFAVLGNILMMVFVPVGESLRGIASKFTCVLLCVWLLQEMRKNQWQTVKFDQGYFIFNSAPLPWILCHSIYRLGLITMPIFSTLRYILLEPLSLLCMYGFFKIQGKRFPSPFYFGLADTLVVAILAVAEKLLTGLGSQYTFSLAPYTLLLEWIFIPLEIVVSVIALRSIMKNFDDIRS